MMVINAAKEMMTLSLDQSAMLGRVTSEGALSQPKRKLIAAPRITLDIEDDDDDDLSDIPPSSPPLGSHYLSGGSAPPTMRRTTHRPDTATDGGAQTQWSRMAYDLATYVSPNGTNSDNRRHSICVCETPGSSTPPTPSPPPGPAPRLMGPIPPPAGGSNLYTPKSSPPSLPVQRTLSANSMGSSPANALTSHSQNQRDFLSSAHFAAHLDCLSLTLEEVVHIRNVLTKADLEALPLDLTIKEDMAKGKICFLCMKVRFSFFGQWSVECRLCKRNVCKKCVSKMRIPTEHFGNIPVLMLTPQALSPREDEEESPAASLSRQFLSRLQEFPRGAERRMSMSTSVGSAPSSPTSTHKGGPPYSLPGPSPNSPPFVHDDIKSCSSGIKSSLKKLFRSRRKSSIASSAYECNVTPEILKQEQRQQLQRSHTSPGGREGGECSKEQLRGQLMSVCGDCKAMVLHVLLSIRLRRDQHLHRAKTPSPPPPPPKHIPQRQHLHLNLTPVYN